MHKMGFHHLFIEKEINKLIDEQLHYIYIDI